jgi:hypothetical protein
VLGLRSSWEIATQGCWGRELRKPGYGLIENSSSEAHIRMTLIV